MLVNNAGITKDTAFHKMTLEQWTAVINTNLGSLFNMTRPVIEGMRARKFGRVINISSINGQKGQFGQVTRHRSRGIIVDVTSLDVMDSFVSRSLRGIAMMTRLRGAETVIVGIQPEVAFAMVQLGMSFEDVQTALDLEEGLALLEAGFGGS